MLEIAKYNRDEIVYLDESGINKFLYREYARAPRGEQVLGEIKGRKYQRLSMIAALCDNKIIAPFTHEITTDAKLFNGWLEQCLLPELRPGQVVVMDNYSIHKSAKTKALIESAGCKLLFLPAYSPDLNPIENYWAIIKAKIKYFKSYCSTFDRAIQLAFLNT